MNTYHNGIIELFQSPVGIFSLKHNRMCNYYFIIPKLNHWLNDCSKVLYIKVYALDLFFNGNRNKTDICNKTGISRRYLNFIIKVGYNKSYYQLNQNTIYNRYLI